MAVIFLSAAVVLGIVLVFALKAFFPKLSLFRCVALSAAITLIIFVILAMCMALIGLHVTA